jgi:cytochrome b561
MPTVGEYRLLMIRDDSSRYGLMSQIFHWGMAAGIIALFALGWWMVRLDYYDYYYTRAPALHRSTGMVILFALLLRIAWRFTNTKPVRAGLTPFELKASRLVHLAFYPLLICLMLSGYLISTADGRPIDVFGWLEVPALIQNKSLADIAGPLHRWIAYSVMALTALHASAAIKHALARHSAQLLARNPSISLSLDQRSDTQ